MLRLKINFRGKAKVKNIIEAVQWMIVKSSSDEKIILRDNNYQECIKYDIIRVAKVANINIFGG